MTVRHRIRLRFRKEGDLRWIGHRDLVRALERLFRRAALPLSMSEGFRRRPRMIFPMALAVGVRAVDEVFEVELGRRLTTDEVLSAVRTEAPRGLVFTSAEIVSPGAPKPAVESVSFELPVPENRQLQLRRNIEDLLESESCPIQREGRKSEIDLRAALADLRLADGRLGFRIRVSRQGTPRPREVLAALEIEDIEHNGCQLTRTVVELTT